MDSRVRPPDVVTPDYRRKSITILIGGPFFGGFTPSPRRARDLNSGPAMTISLFRRLGIDSEPPRRREFAVALVTVYAIVVTILAIELVERFRDTEIKDTTTYSRLRSFDV